MRLTTRAWYGPSNTVDLVPVPKSWQGWTALAAFVIATAATVALDDAKGWPARMGLLAAYFVVCVFSYDPEV